MRGVDLNTIYITINPKIDLERCFWRNELQKIPSWKVSYDIQTLKWSIWDYRTIFCIFKEIPQFHENAKKLTNTDISVRDVENWPPGHKIMQVYWFSAITLPKIALIGLRGSNDEFGPLTLCTDSRLLSEFVQIRLIAQKVYVTKKSKTQGVMPY